MRSPSSTRRRFGALRALFAPRRARARATRLTAAITAGLLAVVGLVGVPTTAALADTPTGCNYATGLTSGNNICWFDFSSMNQTTVRSAGGQQFTLTLGSGYTASFTLTSVNEGGTQSLVTTGFPTYAGAWLGRLGYTGVAGSPVLKTSNTPNWTKYTVSNFTIRNAVGTVMSGYSLLSADAEETGISEGLNWTSDVPLTDMGGVAGSTACSGGLTGNGTTNVTCNGSTSTKNATAILAAPNATTITAELRTAPNSSVQGIAFGILVSQVNLTKVISSSFTGDQFTVGITDAAGAPIGTNVTSAAGAGSVTTTQRIAFAPTAGTNITFTESPGNATTDLSSYRNTWACTQNGSTVTGTPAAGTTTSWTGHLDYGKTLSCTITNTRVAAGTVTLAKSWTNPTSGDVASLSVQNTTRATVAVADVTAPATTPTASVAVRAGDSVSIAEAFTAGTDRYSTTATCTGGVGSVPLTANAGTFTVPASLADGSTIACTISNVAPDVQDVTGAGSPGQPIQISPAGSGIVPSTVQFPTAGQPAGSTVSPDGKTLTVPGQGVWTINPTTGVMTFTPESGFSGAATPVSYTAADAEGNLAAPATASATSPDVSDVTGSASPGNPAVVQPALGPGVVASTVRLLDGSGNPVSTLAVPGEGTWTVNATTGAMTFTPEAGFTGQPTSVQYVASDANGNTALPASVTVSYPTAAAASGSAAPGQPVVIQPVLSGGALPERVQLLDANGNPTSTLTVPGEGVWTVDPTTGAITFNPEAGFTGQPTPVQYIASDANGNATAPATATASYPAVADSSASAAPGDPVVIQPALSGGAQPDSVQLLDANGNPTSTLTVPGEGVWTVDPTTGAITFTPEAGFTGQPTPVQYVASDADGNQSLPATATAQYPQASNATGAGQPGQPATVTPVLDGSADPTTVQLLDANGNPTSTLTVPGEGVWTVDPTTGVMTFTPEAGFTGQPSPVQYVVSDADGNQSLPASASVSYPAVAAATGSATPGQPVVIQPELSGGALPESVQLLDANGNPTSTLTVPGEGVWTVDPTTGAITFTPEAGFTGQPTPVQYVASDADGNTSLPATATAQYPQVSDASSTAAPGSPVTITPVLDGSADPSTVQLLDANGNPTSTLTVPGEGVWTVDPTTGAITFTPEAGFTGQPTPVQYVASDADGNQSLPATATAQYPQVSNATAAGAPGSTVQVTPVLGGSADPTTVQLLDANGNPTSTLTVPGEGVWTVDPTTGVITFTPEAGFTGQPSPVQYVASDAAGNQSLPATIAVTYPQVFDAVGLATPGQPAQVTPILDGGALPETVQLLDATGNPTSTLTVPGEGVWTVDPTTGVITFTPEAGFTGQPTPVQYVASDADGNQSLPASATATYAAVNPASGSASQGEPAIVLPVYNDGMDPSTVMLVDANGDRVASLDVPGEGVWTVDPSTGAIVFTPVSGFQGQPTPVLYTAADAAGNYGTPASVTVSYPDAAAATGSAAPGAPVVIQPVLSGGALPESVQLLDANGNPTSTLTVPGEGVWTVDPTTGAITFTPEAGFSGQPTAVQYIASDADGNSSLPASATAMYPQTDDVPVQAAPGATFTVAPALDGSALPESVQLLDADGNPTSTLTVPGEGVWTVDPTTGAITFTPEAGFTTAPSPIQYVASDANGNTSLPGTITTAVPTVAPVNAAAAPGEPASVTPVLSGGALPETVRLLDANGNQVTRLPVPGEGVWTVDPNTGTITFTPVEGFTGQPTPQQYVASDAQGNTSLPQTVSASYPTVGAATGSANPGEPTQITPDLSGGALPETVRLIDPATGDLVTRLEVPGKGVWTVDPNTGVITFTPVDGFTGEVSVQYVASDADGNVSDPATATAVYPGVQDATGRALPGQPVTVTPVLGAGMDPTTVALVAPDGSLVKSLEVPGEGVWSVDPATGDITFTPVPGFTGQPTPVSYTAADSAGHLAEPATATAIFSQVGDASGAGDQGSPVTVAPVLAPGTDPSTVRLIDPDSGEQVRTVTVPGEGVWTVDPTTGAITFTPEDGFQGQPTPIGYTATDADGNVAPTATVTISYPDVSDARGAANPGEPVQITPVFGPGIDPTTVSLVAPDGSLVTRLEVPGEGVWTVDPETGVITFTPIDGFTGQPTPVQYVAEDAFGHVSEPATATAWYPEVFDTVGTGAAGEVVRVTPDLGPGMDPSTVVLIDPATGERVTRLEVPGEGVWTVDPITGEIIFTPEDGFMGVPSPVSYTASDGNGHFAVPATISLELTGVPTPTPTPTPTETATPTPTPTPTETATPTPTPSETVTPEPTPTPTPSETVTPAPTPTPSETGDVGGVVVTPPPTPAPSETSQVGGVVVTPSTRPDGLAATGGEVTAPIGIAAALLAAIGGVFLLRRKHQTR